jgi:hypothetical protein
MARDTIEAENHNVCHCEELATWQSNPIRLPRSLALPRNDKWGRLMGSGVEVDTLKVLLRQDASTSHAWVRSA